MFVLEALVLTFLTTPLVTWLYPPHLRRHIAATGATFGHVADDDEAATDRKKQDTTHEGGFKTRFTVVLDKLEHLPGMMALTQLIQPPLQDRRTSATREPSTSTNEVVPQAITTEALRLIELSDRVSAVMKSSFSESLLLTDPLLSIFRMFGQLNGIRVAPSLSIVKFEDLAYSVADHARNYESDMILVPWLPPVHDAFEHPAPSTPTQPSIGLPATAPLNTPVLKSASSHNPFDILFKSSQMKSSAHGGGTLGGGIDVSNSVAITHSQFVRGVFSQSTIDVALFVDQSTLDSSSSIVGGLGSGRYDQHIFLPFFGGPDDRLALEFVVQICANPRVRGTVVRISKCDEVEAPDISRLDGLTHLGDGTSKNMEEINALTVGSVWRLFLLFLFCSSSLTYIENRGHA